MCQSGSSHGHKPVLHAAFVRPFVQTNKTDMADAKAIWTAVRQPGMRQVAPKTETQQAVLALHAFRALRVKTRTMLVNQLRGTLCEFGAHFRRGRRAGLEEIRQHMAELEQQLPRVLFDSVGEQLQSIARLDDEIGQIEIRLNTGLKVDHDCQTVAAIPGIGPLTATALVATIGDGAHLPLRPATGGIPWFSATTARHRRQSQSRRHQQTR